MNHAEYANGLRAIADWIETHPEVAIQPPSDHYIACEDTREAAAAAARALGSCEKEITSSTLSLCKTIGGLRVGFVFWRSSVCERRVVGSREVAERIIPAHTEEIVEWDCASILGGEERAEPIAVAPITEDIPF